MANKKWAVKRVDVLSVAKVYTVIMAVVGLILSVLITLLGTAAGLIAGSLGPYAGLGVLSIVFLPITFALYGFIFGALGSILYNLVAGKIGGIKVEFDEK